MKQKHINRQSRCNREAGYTLLEYCAGAAVICGILWVAMSNLGNSVGTLLDSVSTWAGARSTEIQSSN